MSYISRIDRSSEPQRHSTRESKPNPKYAGFEEITRISRPIFSQPPSVASPKWSSPSPTQVSSDEMEVSDDTFPSFNKLEESSAESFDWMEWDAYWNKEPAIEEDDFADMQSLSTESDDMEMDDIEKYFA